MPKDDSETYLCPVCGYPGLSDPPVDEFGCATFEICPCCGTEFGYHDARRSHSELRSQWIENGRQWIHKSLGPPLNWDPQAQLKKAGLVDS
jgi:hypothetical protein